ncbi:hypothetical protein PGT21_027608 [Puccinia graminis f. sp. tritici]|uniref:Uncharacterized protein n=1 Tax=Puccinia graminis f. sp. tritici TaxID=56615 RepID=A0A5B0SB74_PUCGR|nr:hypothetical protein PGT21_027608 [Puccinia graminis f. sp. tritici]KAA1135208.1 hypothetical protein PGTUg99_014293 [Puccinia graminis f. sp. tritici]
MQFGTPTLLILLTVASQIFAQLVPKRNDSTCKAGMAHYCVTRKLPGRDGKKIVGVYSPLHQPTKNCHLVISNSKRSENCCDPFKFKVAVSHRG